MSNSTLLLADDSITIQKVINLTFADENIDVVSVNDGNSALDHLREHPADLVMADVNIPGVNGYEICEKVKSMGSGRDIPVILLVGSFEPFDEEKAKRVGADGYLTKPFESIGRLVEQVNAFIGSKDRPVPRLDETMEYPPGAEMVVGEQQQMRQAAPSYPPSFKADFEDETIETERVGITEEQVGEQPYEEMEPPQHSAGTADADYPGPHDSPDETDSAPVSFHDQEHTEPPPDDFETQPLRESVIKEYELEKGFETTSQEPAEKSEAGERSYFAGSFPAEAPMKQPVEASGLEAQTEFGTGEDVSETDEFRTEADLGAVTVELDDSDLLELPVGGSSSEGATEQSISHGAQQTDPYPDHIQQAASYPVYEEVHPASEPSSELSTGELSDEMIEKIAIRVVEKLSDKTVREIAWEVVPELAEIIIKKMTEQKLNE